LVPQTTTFPLHLPPEITRALLRPRSDDDTRGTQVAGLPSFLVAPTASTTGSTQSIAPIVTQRNPLPWTLPNVRFRKLAFFDELAVVLPPTILQEKRDEWRRIHHITPSYKLTPQHLAMMAKDESIQLQLRFCALDSSAPQEDRFPASLSVYANTDWVIRAPILASTPVGTAGKPLNITARHKLEDTLSVFWASDSNDVRYALQVTLVKPLHWKTLLMRLSKQKPIPSSTTRRLIQRKMAPDDNDDDIIPTDLRVSLICPIVKKRMKHPCKFTTCKHIQCFSPSAFLQMNERSGKSSWFCPICDGPGDIDSLALDEYFYRIVKDAPEDVTEIGLEIGISWKPTATATNGPSRPTSASATSSSVARLKRRIEELMLEETVVEERRQTPPMKRVRIQRNTNVTTNTNAAGATNSTAAATNTTAAGATNSTATATTTSSDSRVNDARNPFETFAFATA